MVRKRNGAGGDIRKPEPAPEAMAVREARVAYITDTPGDGEDEEAAMSATTRLSGKNQITLPAAMVRQLGLRAGDEIELLAVEDRVTLARRPRTPEEWVARIAGAMTHVTEWGSNEAIGEWVRRERDSWDGEWEKD